VTTRKLILDVDTGSDDAVAIMLACRHPALDLLAVTTVNGNGPVDVSTDNTLRVLAFIGQSTPVYAGMHRPLVRPDFPVPRAQVPERAGAVLDLPATTRRPQPAHAVDYLLETVMAASGEVTIVATAPLTNLATAMSREPRFARAVRAIIVAGGTHAVGNVTPAADFNTWADPEAARLVLRSGAERLTLVPLDCTHQALFSRGYAARLRALATPAAAATADLIEERIDAYRARPDMRGLDAAPLHDPLAVAALIDPGLVTTHPLHVDVETKGELTTGRTVIDVHERSGQPPNADVALSVDVVRYLELLMATLGAA
jgi:inosine-uridine nucleoside N-ribohydrolase